MSWILKDLASYVNEFELDLSAVEPLTGFRPITLAVFWSINLWVIEPVGN